MDEIEKFFLENPMSVNTEDRYRRALGVVLAGVSNPGRFSALEFKLRLSSQGWGSSSQWVAYCATRRFLTWRYGAKHPALLLKIRREGCEPQRALNLEQTTRLLESFPSTPKGTRDLAMCALMLDSGLRASEVCALSLNGLDLAGCVLSVRAKGGKVRQGIFSTFTQLYLDNWLSLRVRIAMDQNVFVALGGLTPGYRLTREGLQSIVRRWGIRIGITLSPHDLRRTFAVLATHAGAPPRVLMLAGRWSSLEMVERYTGSISASAFREFFPVGRVMG